MTKPPIGPDIRAIEFFGLPGAGKTTLARHLIARLNQLGVKAEFSRDWMGDGLPLTRRTSRRLGLIVGEVVSSPREIFSRALMVSGAGHGLSHRMHSGWNFLSVQAMQSRQLRNSNFLVLDQGAVQGLWTLLMCDGHTSLPHAPGILIGRDWVKHTLFVEACASTGTAMQRLGARAERSSRMQRSDQLSDFSRWKKGASIVADLREALECELADHGASHRLLSVKTDSQASTDELARLVADRALSLRST